MSSAPDPNPRPARRRVGVEGQRITILASAIRVLETRPYEQLSVEDVLKEANVSRQTFYRCFPNKNALFHTIFRDGNAMFLAAIKSLDKTGADPVQVMDRALTGALLFVIHGGGALRALYRETIRPDGEFAPYRKEVLDALVADVGGWARDELHLPVDPLLVRAVMLSVEQLAFEMAGRGVPSPAEMERFRKVVLTLVEGVLHELQRLAAAQG